MSDPSAPRNECNNLTYHGHGVENKNDNNNINDDDNDYNDDDDNDDDADDNKSTPSNVMLLTEEELLDYLQETYPDSDEIPDEIKQFIKDKLPENNTVVENEFQSSTLMFPQSQAMKYVPVKEMKEQLDEYDLKVFDGA